MPWKKLRLLVWILASQRNTFSQWAFRSPIARQPIPSLPALKQTLANNQYPLPCIIKTSLSEFPVSH